MAAMTEYSFRNEWLLAITGEFKVRFQSSYYHWNTFPSLRHYITPCYLLHKSADTSDLISLMRTAVWLLSWVMTKVILFGSYPVPPPMESWHCCRYPSLVLINNQNMIPLICLFHFPTSTMHVAEKLFWLLKSLLLPCPFF